MEIKKIMNNTNPFWKDIAVNSAQVLDPVSRNLEVMFGIIMALSFTSTISITHNGNAQIHHFLWSILGCNLAWGIIDGLTFMISGLLDRARRNNLIHAIRNLKSKEEAISMAREDLQPLVAAIIKAEQLEQLYHALITLPPPPKRVPLLKSEIKGAFTIFLINFFSTLPIVLPFMLLSDPINAKHFSDAVSLSILFSCGYSIGKYSGYRAWFCGIGMVLVGAAFLLITIVLGG